jgi:hypothetical protein
MRCQTKFERKYFVTNIKQINFLQAYAWGIEYEFKPRLPEY